MSCDAQAYITNLQPYQPGLPIEAVARQYKLDAAHITKLASNENPLGMSPKAREALEAAMPGLHRYPEQYDLVQAIAEHTSLQPEQVVVGNGSNDVLDLIARTFLGVGREAVSSQYAFAIYQIVTQSVGASNIVVAAHEYGHDLSAMLKAITPKTSVLWIANPNNPTGSLVQYSEVKRFLQQVPPEVVVVLDEAYYEYLPAGIGADSPRWLAEFPNLVLVRTFSKIYGLAGLRVGYGLASPQIIELLNRVRQPFNVGVAGIAAATAALQDTAFVAQSARANQTGVLQLRNGLGKLEMKTLPAYGNFVTFTPGSPQQTAAANQYLLQRGVIVRPLAAYGMPEYLRVTAGTDAEISHFLTAMGDWQRSSTQAS